MTDAIGPQTVGDRCFIAYRDMLRRWRKSPRWTTAHEIYRDDVMAHTICESTGRPRELDEIAALHLAWQVFFVFHVLRYEEQKRIDNGEVETE